MISEIEMLYCPSCARESQAEAPPCLDGHENCPERACVDCGTALVLDAGLIALIPLIDRSIPASGSSAHRRRNVA